MLTLRVAAPIACFRKGRIREYLETEPLPPPATCYGFLLSLVGETRRAAHVGCRVSAMLLDPPPGQPARRTRTSVVLRTVWRVKNKPLGASGNTRPDYQQLLSPVELLVWLDSADEASRPTLEDRVRVALDPARRGEIDRFGGLCLGESTHLVDEVDLVEENRLPEWSGRTGQAFLRTPRGRLNLPVWVDHVGSRDTRFAVGDLERRGAAPPDASLLPRIHPEGDLP